MSEVRSASSAGPGTAIALAEPNANRARLGERPGERRVAATLAKAAGEGTCWWNEKATEAACCPRDPGRARRYLVTVTPGMTTPENPAPGPPGIPAARRRS